MNKESKMIAKELSSLLANTYTVYLKTQNFHWNVTGPYFPQLHQLFNDQYDELAEAVDVIAERIRAIGSFAPASFAEFQKLSTLKDVTDHEIDSNEMIKKLMQDHEAISQQLLDIFAKTEEVYDQGTMDMLIERLRAHDKMAWMLRSSLV